MRKTLIQLFIIIFVAYIFSSCSSISFTTSPLSQDWPDFPNPETDIDMGPPTLLIITAAVAVAAGLTYAIIRGQQIRKRTIKSMILTPQGKTVKVLIHKEAPQGSLYIADVETEYKWDTLHAKVDLKNQAARLGGNLLVIDFITKGKHTYSAGGRVYKIRSSE